VGAVVVLTMEQVVVLADTDYRLLVKRLVVEVQQKVFLK